MHVFPLSVQVKKPNLRRLVNRAVPATLFERNAKNVVVRLCLVMPHGAVTAAPACHFGTAVNVHTLVTSPLQGEARDLRHYLLPP